MRMVPIVIVLLLTSGILSTLGVSLLRCSFNAWSGFGPSRAPSPVNFGTGDPTADGRLWYWTHTSNCGEHVCGSLIINQEALDSYLKRPNYVRGSTPSWAASAEAPVPPGVSGFSHSNIPPKVVDIAYGWPLPCLALRIENFEEVEVSEEEASSLRMTAKPGSAILRKDGRFFYYPGRVPHGSYRQSWLFNHDLHTGFWPTRVLWSNLAINVMVNSFLLAIPLLLWAGFRTGRREFRRRRGLCQKCGYPAADLPAEAPCPECGASVSWRK